MGDVHADDQRKKQAVADLKLQDHLSWSAQKRAMGAAEPGGGPMLNRSCSSATHRFGRTTSTTTLRRTFSMRKSASVREGGYRRIHDNTSNSNGTEAAADAGDHEDGGHAEEPVASAAAAAAAEDEQVKDPSVKKKRKSRIRRACKKLFGF